MPENTNDKDIKTELEGTTEAPSESVKTDEVKNKPRKRGRKPGTKRRGYFYEEEEQAFYDYVTSDDQAFRDRIFAEKLYPAFTIMIESIIRRYGLFTPDEDFEDTLHDTMSFMITKVNNFDFSKGKKVYSYCGTVCKNYLLLKRIKATKRIEQNVDYDSEFNPNKNDRPIESDNTNELYKEVIRRTVAESERILKEHDEGTLLKPLNNNEYKVGKTLVYLLNNWDYIFNSLGTNKFNKTSVLYFLRENTGLSTKEVRSAMRRFKDAYFEAKKDAIES